MVTVKKLGDFKIGDKAEIKHVITTEDIKKFVELTGDDNKLHIDEDFAATTSYKKPVAHGMLGASFISTIIGTKLPGDGALWYAQNLEFLLPVRVNDEITITAVITKIIESNNSIELLTEIHNQHKQKVTTGHAKVKLVEKEIVPVDTASEDETKKINALVIGGTGGIGNAVCIELAKAGYNVAIHYHSRKKIAEEIRDACSKYPVKTDIFKADINDINDITSLKESLERKFGHINLIINCSTVKIPALKFETLQWEDFESHININIKSNFLLSKIFLPDMIADKKGAFIAITTQYTESTPPAELTPYVTAKNGLNGLFKSLAVEFASKGIRFNLVSPGMTETDLIADLPEKVRILTSAKTPLKRLAKPEDVAKAVLFLAGNDAGFITGETIRVNGGQTMM